MSGTQFGCVLVVAGSTRRSSLVPVQAVSPWLVQGAPRRLCRPVCRDKPLDCPPLRATSAGPSFSRSSNVITGQLAACAAFLIVAEPECLEDLVREDAVEFRRTSILPRPSRNRACAQSPSRRRRVCSSASIWTGLLRRQSLIPSQASTHQLKCTIAERETGCSDPIASNGQPVLRPTVPPSHPKEGGGTGRERHGLRLSLVPMGREGSQWLARNRPISVPYF